MFVPKNAYIYYITKQAWRTPALLKGMDFPMLITVLLFVAGLILIVRGGDKFVDAAVDIAKTLGVSELLIGATIVSIGTTLPEILVSTMSAVDGYGDIATGNAFGSIICNTAFIAGLTQLIRPSAGIDRSGLLWRSVFFFLSAAVLFFIGLYYGHYGFVTGLVLVLGFCLFSFINIRSDRGSPVSAGGGSAGGHLIVLAVCAAALFVGARLLVDNGIVIARYLGVPERVIAVTFIALGTSLPELVTAISALTKGRASVSLGNIVGANIIDCLLVIGVPALISGISPADISLSVDLPIAVAAMLLLTLPIILRGRGSRIQGAALVTGYFAYCIMQF